MYLSLLLRWRKSILAIWVVLLVTSLFFLTNKLLLSSEPIIDNSVSIWFDEEDDELLDYQSYNNTFGEEEWSLLLLETGSIYSKTFLRDLKELTDKIGKLKHVEKVTSITNVRDNFSSADGMLDYRELYSDSVLSDPEALNRFREALERNPIFEKNIILKNDDRYTVVLIQNANLVFDKSTYRITLVDAISDLTNRYASIKNYALAGTTVINAELNRAAKRDVFVFYALVTVLLTFIAFFMLKSIRNILVMYAVVITSALPTMGLIAALNIPYNMVTVMLPTILIALSVAGVIHIITDFHRERETQNSGQAIKLTLNKLYKPTIWTTVTTIIGFSAFTTSQVFPVFQLGAFAAFGLTLACVANLIIAPILLPMLWPESMRSPASQKQNHLINQLRKTSSPKIVLFLSLILALPLYGLSKLEVDTNYIKFFSESHDTTRAYELLEIAGFAQNPIIVHFRFEPEEPYSHTDSLKGTLAFESALKKQTEVIKLLTPSDFLDEINQAFNESDALPLSQYDAAQIEQLLLLGELSGNDDLTDFLEDGASEIQLVAMTQYMSSSELHSFKEKLYALKKQYLLASSKLKITGTTTLWANMDTQVSQTQFFSLLTITLFLALFLPLIFKSIKLGMIGLLINVIPLAVTLGCMSLLGIKINMATALIGGISLGVVVDDTIHFITRLIQNRQQGQDIGKAIDNTLESVGKSIIRTTLILVVGFSCMASSQFLPTAHFGMFISLSIVLALILDLICLPALLKSFPQIASEKRWHERNSIAIKAKRIEIRS